MNVRTDFFKAVDFNDGITRIEATGGVYCYLVEGRKRALLIDTMTGLGNLRLYVQTLTRKPVTVVCTHGHFDHIGGVLDFDEAWLPELDAPMIADHTRVDRRYWFENRIRTYRHLPLDFTRDDFTPPRQIAWHGYDDGARFDLGWRIVTAVALPGHTRGSVCLLDSKTGILFSGDAASRSTFMFLDQSTSTQTYLRGLLHLKRMRSHQISEWYNFHNYTEMPPTIVDDLIQGCRDALDGKITGPVFRDNPDFRFVYPIDRKWNRLDGKDGNLIVRLSRLRDE